MVLQVMTFAEGGRVLGLDGNGMEIAFMNMWDFRSHEYECEEIPVLGVKVVACGER